MATHKNCTELSTRGPCVKLVAASQNVVNAKTRKTHGWKWKREVKRGSATTSRPSRSAEKRQSYGYTTIPSRNVRTHAHTHTHLYIILSSLLTFNEKNDLQTLVVKTTLSLSLSLLFFFSSLLCKRDIDYFFFFSSTSPFYIYWHDMWTLIVRLYSYYFL